MGDIADEMLERYGTHDDMKWNSGLSVRAANCLSGAGIYSREEALQAFQSGRLKPGKVRNYGKLSHKEVARWLGLPVPQGTQFTRKQVTDAIDAEEELPGGMPKEIWDMLRSDERAAAEVMRANVRAIKANIKARLGL